MTDQDALPKRLRAGRYQQIGKQLDAIACAIDELREILARLIAADEDAG